MQTSTRKITAQKRIALIAHDHCKQTLLTWCHKHQTTLAQHILVATGTTGSLIEKATSLNVTALLSGPMGGDQQIGALIAEGKIDLLVFLWDPLNSVPHDPDVKALLRIATVWNIPVATNVATADILLEAGYLHKEYEI